MNQYHIYEAIGRGKHSTVYKGRKKKTIEYFAIKSVEKSQKSRVLQEVRTLHSLDHPNVLKFFAWYETSAHLWLVLEYCVGGDLLTLLRQDSRLPEESIHDFARDLVNALQFLHSKGVIYCDLKPSNILLDENGRLKLCDFGLARRLPDISKNSVQQLPQSKRGTPCYMAPELFQEGGVQSFASDLWALGCVMYECYAGRPPFVSNSFTQLVNSILSDPTPCLQGNPSKEFQDLVSRLLVKDPAKRVQWSDLCQHPFWRAKIKLLHLPSQPAFTSSLHLLQQNSNNHEASENNASHGSPIIGKRSGNSEDPYLRTDRSGRKHENQVVHRKAMSQLKDVEPSENIAGSKGINTRNTPSSKNGTHLKETPSQRNCGVNLVRLSKIVKTNLQRETEGGNYRQQLSKAQTADADLTIENNDLELDFGERTEADSNDDDDTAESSSCSDVSAGVENTGSSKADKNSGIQYAKVEPLKSENTNKMMGGDTQLAKEDQEKSRPGLVRMEVAATPPGVGLPRRTQRAPSHADHKKFNLSSPVQGTTDPPKTSLLLSQALWHPSDLAVRPIMVYKRTERLADPGFEPRILPFDPINTSDMLKLCNEELETFSSKLLASISGNTSLNEKLNTLKYLETLCTNVEGANILINSPLMHMLVKMLRTSKPPALRIQVIYTMGLLIRHATLIEEELASSGIMTVLSEGLRDKQDKVRRCSMATLGELLFYIATQSEVSPRSACGSDSAAKEARPTSAWQVPSTLVGQVTSILRKGEDDIAQHYALKTIENISSQGGDWAARFTNQAVLENLCYIFKASAKQESVRLTAGSCLVRLLRFSNTFVPFVLDKLSLKDMAMGLTKGNLREQQVNINLIILCLMGSSPGSISKQLVPLYEEKTLVSTLSSMLEQSTELLRGKSAICAAFLCKVNRRWLGSICNSKLLAIIERLIKEKDAYAKQCIDALIQTIAESVPNVLESIDHEMQGVATMKRPNTAGLTHNSSQSGRSQNKYNLLLFTMMLQVFESPVFREKVINSHVLKQLSGFLNSFHASFLQGQEDFLSILLRIFEVVGQQSSVLLGFPELFLREVLPSLAILYRKHTSADIRFLCLKTFFDILAVYLDDESSTARQGAGKHSASAGQEDLKNIAKQQFLPYYSKMMDDDDPIPMYAQKLLVMLLDIKCIKIEDILHLKLISHFFDFLRNDFSTVNLHNVRLCHFLASAPEVKTSSLSQLEISGRVGALLEFVHGRDMEDFLEPSLSLCKSLLMRCSKERQEVQDDVINDIGEFINITGVLFELCCRDEPSVAELAAQCVLLLVRVHRECAALVLTSKMPLLKIALEFSCRSQGSRAALKVQKLLLLTVSVVCKECRADALLCPKETLGKVIPDISAVASIVSQLKSSTSQMVLDAATEAGSDLDALLGGRSG